MRLGSPILTKVLVFLIGVLVVLLLNQLAGIYRIRLDLTEEKRYTLHPSTKEVLQNLSGQVQVEVYLDGELPSNFKRFQRSIVELLEQFAYVSGNRVDFKFTDPSIASSNQARNQYYRSLIDLGIQPSNVAYTRDGQKTEKLIFPGALITYRGQEVGISLLKGNRAMSIEEMLNQSIVGLEFEFANAFKQLEGSGRRRVGLVTGHNEPDTSQLAGLTNAILAKYDLYRINLPERRTPLTGYDAILLGKPTASFSENEKYLLDQYVMSGGNLLVFIDALSVDMSKAEGAGTLAIPYELNLEDLFFKYGIRINRDLVTDVNCGDFPVYTGTIGDQPRLEMLPWPYFPVITNYGDHPLVRNLDATWFRFASTIDTVKADGISKTPLFLTSTYTKVFGPPVQVSFNDLQDKLRPEAFVSGVKPLGYLLEGSFTSLYKNRFLPRGVDKQAFRESGVEAKIIVVADGDFIRNDFSLENDRPLPIGMDGYTQTTYANEDFLLNALDYMFDDIGLMLSRNKEVKIRPLDKVKIEAYGEMLKWINLAGPIAILLMFGLVKLYMRRKKFSS